MKITTDKTSDDGRIVARNGIKHCMYNRRLYINTVNTYNVSWVYTCILQYS